MMGISAIIVNYNVKYYVEQCIRSLLAASANVELEIYVVDNASADGSVSHLRQRFPQKRFPQVHIIAGRHNVGFGRANNHALRNCKNELILFINPDTVVSEHTLDDCVDFYQRHPDMGALGVHMINPNGRFAPESRRGLPTPFSAACRMIGLSRLFPKSRLVGGYNMQYLDEHEENEIPIVSGAFMMVPHRVLDVTGGFDERFFMYGEDIDLSYRIIKAGFKNYYLPTSILHYKGESTEKSSFRYVHVFYDAMRIYFNKHYKRSYAFIAFPIRLAINVIALFALIQRTLGQWHHWLRPAHKDMVRYLFLGPQTHFDAILNLADEWGLTIDCQAASAETVPEGHNALDTDLTPYRYIIYDTDVYTYDQIFRCFEQSRCQYMGIYHHHRQLMITDEDCYAL